MWFCNKSVIGILAQCQDGFNIFNFFVYINIDTLTLNTIKPNCADIFSDFYFRHAPRTCQRFRLS